MNSSKVVLDASSVLAAIHAESGSEKLTPPFLAGACLSAVNVAEVLSKLVTRGWTTQQAWEDTTETVAQVLPFTAEQAKTAASLISQTRSLGLSLGDRACLALALELQAPVYTADRSWKNLKLGVHIHVIR